MNVDMTLPRTCCTLLKPWERWLEHDERGRLNAISHSNHIILQMTNRKVDKKQIPTPHLLQAGRPRLDNSEDERSSCLGALMRLIDLSKRSSCYLWSDRTNSSYKRMQEADPARLSMTAIMVRSL